MAGMAGPRSWFGVVRKKLVIRAKLTAHPKKNVIIYNNTSIGSTEDDARASCVDPAKDHIATAIDATITTVALHAAKVVEKGGDEEKHVVIQEVCKMDDAIAEETTAELKPPVVIYQEDLAADDDARKEGEEEEETGPSTKEKTAAAITIQSGFKAHLARRAFKALKGLVKLQAVARGVCVRRQARMALNCMNALARLQDRVQARQLLLINAKSSNKS